MGRYSSVGMANSYGLDGPWSNPGGGEIFRTHSRRPWGPPSLLYYGYRLILRGKAAGAFRWTQPPFSVAVKERVDLYLHSSSVSPWQVIGQLYLYLYFFPSPILRSKKPQQNVRLWKVAPPLHSTRSINHWRYAHPSDIQHTECPSAVNQIPCW